MFTKATAVAVIGFLASKAAAQASTVPYAEVANGCSQDIYYELVDANGVENGGVISPGTSAEIDLGAQVSMKMDYDGTYTSPYQFEFNFDPSSGFTYYDFSAINGDPFSNYPRNIHPTNPDCQVISCAAGDTSNDCEYTDPTNYGAPGCPGTGTSQATLNVVIGDGSLTKRGVRGDFTPTVRIGA